MSTEDTKTCPVCGETIKMAAIKCRFCNTDLSTYQASQDAEVEKMLYEGHPAVIYSAWQWIAIVLTLGIAYIYYWIQSLAITYKISSQRIKIERGVLSKTMDSVELFTIEHFDLHKTFGMRLLGYSILRLRSSDPSFNSVAVFGIPGLEQLADTLRECSLRERTRRRITSIIQP
ncbi:MAG TPA: PH domain-containing protein [Burkholderiaceae bacterium]|jgi:membrane protein YdbS with pleckstrin-like domain